MSSTRRSSCTCWTIPEEVRLFAVPGGVRKLRWRVKGKGKSGGVRVIYYIPDGDSFWMLTIYGKGDVESIPGPVLKKIKEAMDDG